MIQTFKSGDTVNHTQFGTGTVEFDKGLTVLIRFEHGFEECAKDSLQRRLTPIQALRNNEFHSPLEVITKIQAEAICSINDFWGVFSRSHIDLLPHQLWVCKKVLERIPARWLIADDVGLGKTIEAGLILWPLISKGIIKRLLILCPASLVEQWQYRLRTMFDIRFTIYLTEADTKKSDFWNTHNQVVASIQTLRTDYKGRHERFFESNPWDLVIVDEAHHLNKDEESGATLNYKFLEDIVEKKLVNSILFFTGTPHRGKNFNFLALLSLLRPDIFDPNENFIKQLPKLCEVMIRNNKQNVTDIKGNQLFFPPIVSSETYEYSPEETEFYEMLTEFILTGKAYASSLDSVNSRTVMLVLIAMQKLASSSVAAIRRALKRRLVRITKNKEELNKLMNIKNQLDKNLVFKYEDLEKNGDTDVINQLDEQILELSSELYLMQNEETKLEELIKVADKVKEETKIKKIIQILENRFKDRPVLFFTEYKATQSLLMSALIKEFNDDCVTFINGDNRAEEVINSKNEIISLSQRRDSAAEQFNAGKVRFLISTEAGGEGIDLQENCHTLIHVDLPWNPMRLHQRVGRLNRYGQTKQVEVITLRNPDTVESRIWDKLNTKINNIMMALQQVMDDPEDLLQLVLGMTSPSMFREIFSEADILKKDSISDWFDKKTCRFGGEDVIDTVKNLVGYSSKFNFQESSPKIPKVDLPELKPFFVSMLTINNRRVKDENNAISFKTPDTWLEEIGIRNSYEEMIFDRKANFKDAHQKILGVGHKLIDKAVSQARQFPVCVAMCPSSVLDKYIFIFTIKDRITEAKSPNRNYIAAIGWEITDNKSTFFKDWELLKYLNSILDSHNIKNLKPNDNSINIEFIDNLIQQSKTLIENNIKFLDLPFKFPYSDLLAILLPFK